MQSYHQMNNYLSNQSIDYARKIIKISDSLSRAKLNVLIKLLKNRIAYLYAPTRENKKQFTPGDISHAQGLLRTNLTAIWVKLINLKENFSLENFYQAIWKFDEVSNLFIKECVYLEKEQAAKCVKELEKHFQDFLNLCTAQLPRQDAWLEYTTSSGKAIFAEKDLSLSKQLRLRSAEETGRNNNLNQTRFSESEYEHVILKNCIKTTGDIQKLSNPLLYSDINKIYNAIIDLYVLLQVTTQYLNVEIIKKYSKSFDELLEMFEKKQLELSAATQQPLQTIPADSKQEPVLRQHVALSSKTNKEEGKVPLMIDNSPSDIPAPKAKKKTVWCCCFNAGKSQKASVVKSQLSTTEQSFVELSR